MIYTAGGGPAPDSNVVNELKRIDPNLFVVWSDFLIDRFTGKPLQTKLGLVREPRWHVWFLHNGRPFHLFKVENEDKTFRPLDGRTVQKIRSDLGRMHSAEQIDRMITDAQEEHQRKEKKRFEDLRNEFFKANEKKFQEAMDSIGTEEAGQAVRKRDKKIVSDGTQGTRGSSHDSIPTTPKEEGWEIPDYSKELGD